VNTITCMFIPSSFFLPQPYFSTTHTTVCVCVQLVTRTSRPLAADDVHATTAAILPARKSCVVDGWRKETRLRFSYG
jgi:hypothetical protein